MGKKKVIITVAPTGNFHGKEANPNLPLQPEEIAAAAYDCYNAGASIVHIHARDKDGVSTNDPNVFKEINTLVREKCEIIIQNSTAPAMYPGGAATVEEGLHSLEAMPEMATLDIGVHCATFRGNEVLTPWTHSFLRKASKMMLEKGIKPELEIFNNSNLDDVKDLIDRELLLKPYSISFVMGMQKVNQGGVSYSPKHLMHHVDLLPADSIFGTLGIGPNQLPATLLSIMLGGNARVGLATPHSAIQSFRLYEVIDYATNGLYLYTSPQVMGISWDAWNKLSPADQELFESLSGKNLSLKAAALYDAEGVEALQTMQEEGVEVYHLTAEDKVKFDEAGASVLPDYIELLKKDGLPGQQLFDLMLEIRNGL